MHPALSKPQARSSSYFLLEHLSVLSGVKQHLTQQWNKRGPSQGAFLSPLLFQSSRLMWRIGSYDITTEMGCISPKEIFQKENLEERKWIFSFRFILSNHSLIGFSTLTSKRKRNQKQRWTLLSFLFSTPYPLTLENQFSLVIFMQFWYRERGKKS